jgi:hypothetical protein
MTMKVLNINPQALILNKKIMGKEQLTRVKKTSNSLALEY